MSKNNIRKQRRKSPKKKFFIIVFSILAVYFVFLVGFLVYANLSSSRGESSGDGGIIDEIVDKVAPLPERTIGLVGVTDQGGGLIDGIMLLSYNSVNNKISIVSIPRDTRVYIDGEMYQAMKQQTPGLYGNGAYMKINAIGSYGGDRGMEFLEEYLEELLDIKIDYQALLDLEGVEYIVDSIGGVEFDVPERMYYSDPTQDLLINIQPGLQVLDGKNAVHLMRFRSTYVQGDLDRVLVQQEFMKVFFEKLISAEAVFSNPSAYFTTLTEYVDTNFGIADALKYLSEIDKIDVNNIENYTIPATTRYIEGVSYVILDENEVKLFAYEIFKKPTIAPEDIVYEDSFDKTIKILNGSGKAGMAEETKLLLEKNSYTILEIGNSNDARQEETIIYISKEGQGSDLQKFFKNSKIVANPIKAQDLGAEIVVVLGTNDELIDSIETTTKQEIN